MGTLETILDRLQAIEDRVATLEGADPLPWLVYAFTEAGSHAPFYIGITSHPRDRFWQHWNGEDSAIYVRLHEVIEMGSSFLMRPLRWLGSRREALDLETILIASTPGLLNRDVGACRSRVGLPGARGSDEEYLWLTANPAADSAIFSAKYGAVFSETGGVGH